MPCRTIVPEQTASSGVSPGAEMSTPWSGDQLPGGEAALFGSGNTNPPLELTCRRHAGGAHALHDLGVLVLNARHVRDAIEEVLEPLRVEHRRYQVGLV